MPPPFGHTLAPTRGALQWPSSTPPVHLPAPHGEPLSPSVFAHLAGYRPRRVLLRGGSSASCSPRRSLLDAGRRAARTLLILTAGLLAVRGSAFAGSLSLAWNGVAEAEGFRLAHGSASVSVH